MCENSSVVSASTAEAALEKLMPAISALDEGALERCNATGVAAVETSRKMVTLLAEDRPAMEAAFCSPPAVEMEELEARALALWAAEKRVDAAAPEPVSNLPALYAEGGKLKERAVKVLAIIAGEDSEVKRTLEKVRPGTGYRDRADDLTALHPFVLERKAEILQKELMIEAEMRRMGEIAPLLLDPKGGPSSEIEAARLLRNQAWTHFLRAYEEIQRHVAFVHYYAPDRLKAYPNLFRHKPAKKKK